MKLDAIAVSTNNIQRAVQFYRLLGFVFPSLKGNEQHVESLTQEGSIRLMIDVKAIIKDIIGEEPKPGNHSVFAIKFDKPVEVNETVQKITSNGFKVVKEPWDAFWGQRYAIVEDPDGYKIDLYAALK